MKVASYDELLNRLIETALMEDVGDGDHTIKERALKSSFESRIELMTKILNHFQKNL